MALTDYKITGEDIGSKGITAAPDKLSGTAAENKALFDRLVREIVAEKMNGLIDAVVTELAGKMAAPGAEGVPGQYLRIGENGMEWGVPAGGGDMVESVYDTNGDGTVDKADEAGNCTGNAATATKLKTARTLRVQDASGSNSGTAKSFDGSDNVLLPLPSKIKVNVEGDVSGNCTGNAATATKLQTARTITVQDADGSNKGTAKSFNGTGNVALPLPATIKAEIAGNAATATRLQSARKIGEASFNGTADITLAAMGATKAANINVAANTLTAFTARRIYIGTAAPSASVGAVGDLWVVI